MNRYTEHALPRFSPHPIRAGWLLLIFLTYTLRTFSSTSLVSKRSRRKKVSFFSTAAAAGTFSSSSATVAFFLGRLRWKGSTLLRGFDSMDQESRKFGRGPRDLTGAVDLIRHYKLLAHYDFFCKRTLPFVISETHYFHNVVGDTDIKKGEGVELEQLLHDTYMRDTDVHIKPFDLDTLRQAFQLRETAPIDLPSAKKGIQVIGGKLKSKSEEKERKHKKHKDRDKEKDKEHKKHKHRHKDRSKDKDKDKSGHHDSGVDHTKKHQDKKRKHERSEDFTDIHKHKKSKHRSSMVDDIGMIKVAG